MTIRKEPLSRGSFFVCMIISGVVQCELQRAEIRGNSIMKVVPPATIKWLVDAVGEQEALSFVESSGGRRIWVPTKAKGSKLSTLYGQDVAEALCLHCGGEKYDVPLCRRWRIALLHCQGLTNSDIASRVGCRHSYVSKALGMPAEKDHDLRSRIFRDDRQLGFAL
ncbi:helix-turn-helix domain-containing protein [Gluconobacter sp. LMG 31484]|uniref:Helix-turn-helix domain-containing protein n=1 Tax=Gluconobacter vitians TaxID=2728102 RepID=A0ABR9Y4E3_9PROT|nr:helix-turn-helix domain-containing protein [Gluconobacter vitians]MBF0858816.1 helix-turn-helix domain-containing protein [Gluconobacter vitians]